MASVVGGVAQPERAPTSFRFVNALTNTKLGLAVLTSLCVLFVSVAAEPPFLCVRDEDPIQADRLSYARVYAVTTAAGGCCLGFPWLVRHLARPRP